MRALVLGAEGPSVVEDRPAPDAAAEALVRPLLAGVCATDLELVKGYMGFSGVLGHEVVGLVEAAPQPGWVGRRVVCEINCPCGECETCRAGRPTHCPKRSVLGIAGRDGVFAERFVLPVDNLHGVPESVSDEAAVFVEPLAAACRIVEQVHVRPSERVVVLGAGRLGQLCARVLALTGARVVAVDRDPRRLELLPDCVRAELLDAGLDHLAGADLVVDATGRSVGLETATRLVRPGGTLVLKTTVHDAAQLPATPWVIDEVTVVGSRCGPFAPALRLLEAGLVDPTPLVSATFPLAAGVDALRAAADPAQLKVVLRSF